jgi:WhiB family redox-sensing transcriptional regulator
MAETTLTPGAPEGGTEGRRWRRWAACREIPTKVFFPAGNFARMEEKQAKTVCAICPVRLPCLTFALEHDETFGIWGGLSERERRELGVRKEESCRTATPAVGQR